MIEYWKVFSVIGVIIGSADRAGAQDADSRVTLIADTPVVIEIVDPVSSATAVNDRMFAIRLAADVQQDGVTVIPAGTPGEGQVVHAAKSGGLGKAGELILAARRIDCAGIAVPLRGMRLTATGAARGDEALAANVIVPFAGLLVRGGNREVAAGHRATARIASAITIMPGCKIQPGVTG